MYKPSAVSILKKYPSISGEFFLKLERFKCTHTQTKQTKHIYFGIISLCEYLVFQPHFHMMDMLIATLCL
jgi:hypothetical protein